MLKRENSGGNSSEPRTATLNNQQALPPHYVAPPLPGRPSTFCSLPSHQCLKRLDANAGQRLALPGTKPFRATAAAPPPFPSFRPASAAATLPPRGAAAAAAPVSVPRPGSYRPDHGDQHGGGVIPQLSPPPGLLGGPLPPPAAAVARGRRPTRNGRLVSFPEKPEGGQRPQGLGPAAAGVEALQESPARSGFRRRLAAGRVRRGGGGRGEDELSEDRCARCANFHVCRVLRGVAVPQRVRSTKRRGRGYEPTDGHVNMTEEVSRDISEAPQYEYDEEISSLDMKNDE